MSENPYYIEGGVSQEPLQKIVARATRQVSDEILAMPHVRGNTPIERTFFVALLSEINYCSGPFCGLHAPPSGQKAGPYSFGEYVGLILESQIQILDWDVDFVLSCQDDRLGNINRKLIIECDGHAFHERTKEQAARDRGRDRDLQAAGYTVFRFTGSELYRDPCGCAASVEKWAFQTYVLHWQGK